MTEEQILELAKNCEFEVYTNDDGTLSDYFDCYAEQLLKFALAIHEDGYNKGYDRGYEEGYESSIVSSRMNTREEE
jgi:hypothetical protein